MLVVTYSDARKSLASILDRAKKDGAVLIRRADGSCFKIVPELPDASPLDIPPIKVKLKPGELHRALAEAKDAAEPRSRAGYGKKIDSGK